jgi:hypothetical protein
MSKAPTKKPVAKKIAAKKIAAKKPVAKKIAAKKPVAKKAAVSVAKHFSEDTMEAIADAISRLTYTQLKADSNAISRQNIVSMLYPRKKKKRDLLGGESSFDVSSFVACLELLTLATREPVFDTMQYAAALNDCERAGLDVSAMLQVDAVALWHLDDLERLISYLTTLGHLRRIGRFGPEMNMGSAQPLPADAPVDNTEAASSK